MTKRKRATHALRRKSKTLPEPRDLESSPQEITVPMDVIRDSRLTSTAKILYGVVRSFTVSRHRHYNPTLHQISMRSNIGSVVVIRTIKGLAKAGYIRIHKDDGGRRNRYEFLR
jgi:ABC-type ATPase with predicted acetyltransferase domain